MEQTNINICHSIAKSIIEYAKLINFCVETLPEDQLSPIQLKNLFADKYPDYTQKNWEDLLIDIKRTKNKRLKKISEIKR